MWVLTKIGFYSITKKPSHLNPDGPAVFNIRGRDKDDLKRLAELISPDLAKPSLKLEKFHVFALPEKYNLCMAWSKRNTDTRSQLKTLIGTMQSVLKLSGK